jgi:hypothetical protein
MYVFAIQLPVKNGEDQVLEAAACANCGIIDREKANRIAAIVKDKLLMITPNSSILDIMYNKNTFINVSLGILNLAYVHKKIL